MNKHLRKFLLLLPCLLLHPEGSRAITVDIPAGEVVSGGDVHSVVTQRVYGEADNFTVLGKQQVMSGGVTRNSNIYPYGQQDVLQNGISYGTVVQQYAVQNVDGRAYSSSVGSYGTIYVNAGGYAEDTSVDGGSFFVSSGGTAEGTVIASGHEYISGTDNNAKVSGGIQEIRDGGVAFGAQVSGGRQQVNAGGTVQDTTVFGRGTLEVAGKAVATTVQNGGEMTVKDGGAAEKTTVSGGTMTVDEEGIAQNTTVLSGTQYVYGRDVNGRVSGGEQIIEGGGSAENAVVSENGIQQVGFYGTSENTRVDAGGVQTVGWEGTAANTTLNGGTMNVESGGTSLQAKIVSGTQNVFGTDRESAVSGGIQIVKEQGYVHNAVISGTGIQQVDAGGTAENSVIENGGRLTVAGDINGAVVKKGGQAEIQNGGKTSGMSINGGNSYIKSGGEAVSSIISLGTEYVEGKSENARIYIGGSQIVENGGIASGSTVNLFGVQQVADGGQAAESRIIGGTQIVRGTADGTELFAGLQNIETGGLASDTKIHGGIQTVFSGGISRNTEADGGLIVLHSGGIMSGITKITDGILNVAGTNNISDLELKNALVTIIKEPGFSQLQIDKLDGSGIFSISSNLAQNEADHLDIGGGNGNFGLIVHDYSADGNLPAEFKLIDETSSAADNFYLVGNAVDVGAFRYNLQHDGDDWVLHRTQEHTDSSLIAKNTYSSLASLFYTHLNPLYNRFRMKHKRTGKDDGLWIKGIGREIKFRYKDQTKSNMKIYGAEIGYDREIWHNGGKGLQLGLYGGTSDSRQKYDRGGHGDGETQSLGVYSTLSTADNWFVDVVGTYFWHTQKIKSYTPSGSDVNGKYDANAWQVSAFVGKRWDIAESWFVEPYMGLNYMRVDGIDYRTNFNTRVSASAADYLGGSIGVSGGKEFVLADGTVFDAYGRFSLMHDWDGKSPVTVADEIFAEDTSSLRYELGAGIAAAWNETNSAYFEASTQLGSSVRFPWEINIGIQFNF